MGDVNAKVSVSNSFCKKQEDGVVVVVFKKGRRGCLPPNQGVCVLVPLGCGFSLQLRIRLREVHKRVREGGLPGELRRAGGGNGMGDAGNGLNHYFVGNCTGFCVRSL